VFSGAQGEGRIISMSSSKEAFSRLLTPRSSVVPLEPKSLSEETERKLNEIIAHFSKEGYELPTSNGIGQGGDGEKAELSEREMMFLVGIVLI
jgi:hypothetical protein